MLTIASCLSEDHNVVLFWKNAKVKQKALRDFMINLKRVKIVNNLFDQSQKLPKKLVKTLNYDLIIFLSDGSIPLSFAKRNILHFQQPFQNVGGDKILNRIKLKNVNTVICNSQFTKTFIDKEYNIDSKVVYPPVPVDLFNAGEKRQMILTVGRFHEFKKHNEMINLFKKFKNRINGWNLVIAGGLLNQDRKYYDILTERARGNRIKLMPNIEFYKLRDLYSKAKIYWHAAGYGNDGAINPSRMEHFGITTVEAMASGCVPIAFKGGGQKEIIRHAQNGFLWETEQDLERYTMKLIMNENLRKKLSLQAQKDSRRYNVERFCREINRMIDDL